MKKAKVLLRINEVRCMALSPASLPIHTGDPCSRPASLNHQVECLDHISKPVLAHQLGCGNVCVCVCVLKCISYSVWIHNLETLSRKACLPWDLKEMKDSTFWSGQVSFSLAIWHSTAEAVACDMGHRLTYFSGTLESHQLCIISSTCSHGAVLSNCSHATTWRLQMGHGVEEAASRYGNQDIHSKFTTVTPAYNSAAWPPVWTLRQIYDQFLLVIFSSSFSCPFISPDVFCFWEEPSFLSQQLPFLLSEFKLLSQ